MSIAWSSRWDRPSPPGSDRRASWGPPGVLQRSGLFTLALGFTLLLSSSALARTWLITPEGTGDAPTIQAGIDSAAAADTVLLADGVYVGTGNVQVSFRGKGIVVRSEHGPEFAIVDCGGGLWGPTGFIFAGRETQTSVLEGITIRGASCPPSRRAAGIACYSSSPLIMNCRLIKNRCYDPTLSYGGGMGCEDGSAPTVIGCWFEENSAHTMGGGVWCNESSPVFEGCTFRRNSVSGYGGCNGGALAAVNGSFPRLTHCTLVGDSAGWGDHGSAVAADGNSAVIIENCIVAFGRRGEAIWCGPTGSVTVSCTDIYGNVGGDWVGCVASQLGIEGNMSADPLLCDLAGGDFRLSSQSPCVIPQLPPGCGEFLGAWGVGCGATSVGEEPRALTSWGRLKSLYR